MAKTVATDEEQPIDTGDEELTEPGDELGPPEGAEDADDEGPPPEAKVAKKSAKDERQEQKEVAGLQKRITELEASERYWAGQAAHRGEKPADKSGQEDPDADASEFADLLGKETAGDDPDPDKFLDELTATGPKAIRDALKKDLVKKSDVIALATEITKRLIAKERGKIAVDARLGSEFAELRNGNSPLFKEAQVVYQEIVELDPKLANSRGAMLLVAQLAKARLEAKTKTNGNGNRRTEGDEDGRDSERARRIRAQQGETGRGGRADPDEGPEELGPEAAYLAKVWAKTARMKPEELLGSVRDDRRKARRA